MPKTKVYSTHIQRACVALQVALYEYNGDILSQLNDEMAIDAIEKYGKTIAALVKDYVKQGRE